MDELILFNANVITMDAAVPRAGLVAMRDGLIVEVAQDRSLPSIRTTKARVIDCKGRTVLPGFVDAHCHVAALAEGLVSIGLSPRDGVLSIAEIVRRIGDRCRVRAPGTWIRGKGYDEFYLAEKRHPNRRDLDGAAPTCPVRLTHRSGHAHVLNSLALELVGITAETGDPPEGLIDRDLETGEPTGILYGMGGYLASRIPSFDEGELEQGLALANEKLLSCGITSITDASAHNDLRQWRRLEVWKRRGIFRPRVTMMLGVKGFAEWRRRPYSTAVREDQLRTGGVKIIADEVTGTLHPSRKKLNERVLAIHKAGLQAVIHAVEEPVVEAACDAIESALRIFPRPDHRHRIEHCSVCPPLLMDRLKGLGVTVVTQPSFIYLHGARYLKTVPPDQQQHLYVFGTMKKKGLQVAFSSDFPIGDLNPFVGVHAAVTRAAEGGEVVLPREGTARLDALAMYTLSGAAAGFEEKTKGSITPGKVADLVVVSADPLSVESARLKEVRPEMTILGGEIVWSRPG